MATASGATADPQAQLEEKVMRELADGHPYEAQQYVQTFVARKAKTLGRSKTSSLVFHGAKLLLQSKASNDAGALLVWFIEDGAGVDFIFHLEDSELSNDKFCDAQRLLDLLNGVAPDVAGSCVEVLYGPLHILAAKIKVTKNGGLYQRLHQLENLFADNFEKNKKWTMAYKSVLRLNDIPRLAKIVDSWSNDTYVYEKPLFFARSIMLLLADKRIDNALELSKKSYDYIADVQSADETVTGPIAVWHCSIILAELAALPPMPRVDKAKLFGLLMQLYVPNIITRVDSKLVEILEKVGPAAFNYVTQASQQQTPNPMTLLQNMLAGASAPPAKKPAASTSADGFDLNNVMAMLSQMQK